MKGRIALLLLLLLSTATALSSISHVYQLVNATYNREHPRDFSLTSDQRLQNHHFKRCSAIEVAAAVGNYLSGAYKAVSGGRNILVHSPCLGDDSLGNALGNYFEAISCADLAGMDFMAVAKIWEPKTFDAGNAFLDRLPVVRESRAPSSPEVAMARLRVSCACPGSCHERPYAAWVQNAGNLRSILSDALDNFLRLSGALSSKLVVGPSDLSSAAPGTALATIPDAAIHYRCGDNFIGHYGFVPFSAFKDRVPADAKTIYVLAERRSRKTAGKEHLAGKCDAIFGAMLAYLKEHFPAASVVIRRGDDIYVDFARLALAKTTICSASTFCLWPALMHSNSSGAAAYFPKTKLVVGGRTDVVRLGFQWFDEPSVVQGAAFAYAPTEQLLSRLGGAGETRPGPRKRKPKVKLGDSA